MCRSLALSALVLVLVACQSGATVGASCARDSECVSPLGCRFGRCRAECAAQADCPIGATCLLDQSHVGFCSLRDDPDCTSTSCEAPLACVGRECVNVCTVGPECPAGSACVPIGDGRARCVRTDGEDAGLVDAAPADAGLDASPADAASDASVDARSCTPRAHGVPVCDPAIDVVVDDAHSCVRTMNGHVWCWGERATLGRDGDTTGCMGNACPTPAPLRAGSVASDASDVERVALSDYGGCFTDHAAAHMLCWGSDESQAPLGTGTADGARARLVLYHGAPITNVDTFFVFGASAIAADITNQEWYGWGANDGNVMAFGTSVDAGVDAGLPPAPVSGAADLGRGWAEPRSVAAIATHACAVTSDQHVLCWGSNTYGESAPGVSADPVGPTVVAGVAGATQLVVGRTHSCALAGGVLTCWGQRDNLPGASGCGAANCAPWPVDVAGLAIHQLWPVSDADDLCATDVDGQLYCWGGGYGSFGEAQPTRIMNLPPIQRAWLTWSHGCAIDSNSEVWCWGHDEMGELGLGDVHGPVDTQAASVAFP